MVSTISFAAMSMSAILSIGVPVALFLVVRKSYGKGILPALIGGAGFFVFAIVLEQILHLFVLRPDLETGAIALMQRPFLYMLYGAFAAGIFEETARFVSFHILKKRRAGFGVALKHGIGHGGIEAVLIGGATMISNLALGALLNTLGAEGLARVYGPAVFAQAQEIAATSPAMLFLSGAERMMALVIQISLSVAVYYAVYKPRKIWLFPLAILLHALVDCPVALFQVGAITNVWLVEGVILVFAVALAVGAVFLHKRMEKLASQDANIAESAAHKEAP